MSASSLPAKSRSLVVEPSASVRGSRAATGAVLGLVGGLILAATLRGDWLRSHGLFLMLVNSPPLTGTFAPRVTPWSLVALGVGATGAWFADRIAGRAPWRTILVVSFGAALVWAASLAFWDGATGIVGPARASEDYARVVPAVGNDPVTFVRTYVASLRAYSTHAQSHPPGMVLLLWGMQRLGLGGAWWEAALQLGAGAASVPAVLLTVREVGDERLARAAAPFLVLSPIAVAWSSGDAVFLGLGAWATAWIVLATRRSGSRSDGLALAGGLAGGISLLLSYGIVLLGLVPAAVIVARRRWRVALVATVSAALVLGVFQTAGFSWIAGSRASRDLYHMGIALRRPQTYFVWANIAALAVAVGPAVWVGLTRVRHRGLWLLIGGALAAVTWADLSGLSKAEVERIWLPFMPWLVAGAGVGLVTLTARRSWLMLQVSWAIGVQFLVKSGW